MNYEDYWYVVYVKENCEVEVVNELASAFEGRMVPFFLESERIFHNSKFEKIQSKPIRLKFIFVETAIPPNEFKNLIAKHALTSEYVEKVSCDGDGNCIFVEDNDRRNILRFLNSERQIERSKGILVNGMPQIIKGPLVGCENIVKKIDRHARTAKVELEFFGQKRDVEFALEIVDDY